MNWWGYMGFGWLSIAAGLEFGGWAWYSAATAFAIASFMAKVLDS